MARSYISIDTKRQVSLRADHRCEYCKSPRNYATHTFHIEHIVPISAGGQSSLDNLALACANCNGSKSKRTRGIDPASRASVLLFHPRQQKWTEHFAWSQNFLDVLGITPTGRATVNALKLNRENVINLRRVLRAAGVHP